MYSLFNLSLTLFLNALALNGAPAPSDFSFRDTEKVSKPVKGVLMHLESSHINGTPSDPRVLSSELPTIGDERIIIPATSSPTGLFSVVPREKSGQALRYPVLITNEAEKNNSRSGDKLPDIDDFYESPGLVQPEDHLKHNFPLNQPSIESLRPLIKGLAVGENEYDEEANGKTIVGRRKHINNNRIKSASTREVDESKLLVSDEQGRGSIRGLRQSVPCIPCDKFSLPERAFINSLKVSEKTRALLLKGLLGCCQKDMGDDYGEVIESVQNHLLSLAPYPLRLSSNLSRTLCIEDKMSYWSRDLGWRAAESVAECHDLCEIFGGCDRYTYVESEKVCYLKPEGSEIGSRMIMDGHVSGDRCCAGDYAEGICIPDESGRSCYDLWSEYEGFTLGMHFGIEFSEDCQALCRLNSACIGFSWDAIKHICNTKFHVQDVLTEVEKLDWESMHEITVDDHIDRTEPLYNIKGELIKAGEMYNDSPYTQEERDRIATIRNFISGPAVCPGQLIADHETDCLFNKKRFYGHDILPPIKGIASASQCQKLCEYYKECDYWTYNGNTNDKGCWLKQGVYAINTEIGWISGPKVCPPDDAQGESVRPDLPVLIPDPPVLEYDQFRLQQKYPEVKIEQMRLLFEDRNPFDIREDEQGMSLFTTSD